MAEVLFYHLTSSPVEQALADLLERALAREWRAIVRCGSQPAVSTLDTQLWTFRDDSFLPHGTAEMGYAEMQPVYLTCGRENPNRANLLMLVLGARFVPEEAAAFDRICLMFEGGDPDAVAAAREDWRAVLAAGAQARYWAQESGRWVEKARS